MPDMSPRRIIAKALNPFCLHENILTCQCEPGVMSQRDADTVLRALLADGYGVEALDSEIDELTPKAGE